MKRVLLPILFAGCLLTNVQAGEKDGTKEPPRGFTSLFNGKDLSAWKNGDKQKTWLAQDGLIYHTGKGGGNLTTAKNYKDFELFVDWKIGKGGDSGIYLRGKPQVQIWDNKEGSGGLYNNPAKSDGRVPLVVADNKPGEWNTFYIKMVGAKVTVILNGKIVVDNAVFLNGKISDEGTIELQTHGNPLWFRNVFVREIGADKK